MYEDYYIIFRNVMPIFFAVSSTLLTLIFGILQLIGAPPFTERNVTFGWIYISISVTVAAFLGMYLGLGLIYLLEHVFYSYEPKIQVLDIKMDPNEGAGVEDQQKQVKKVRFDFNDVTIV
jgi:hypothetical protein